jgi:hypothetical protein
MLHVEGVKPSAFLSTTREEAGTINPDGDSFGSALYKIDLSYISPANIADLSTGRGMSYFMLGLYDPAKGSSKASLISRARQANEKQQTYKEQLRKHTAKVHGVKMPAVYSAGDTEVEDRTLSGKEWQALMDVVRTKEVLINCEIPGDALEPQGR